jgi:type II secretory pathway pseudopilin PulG
VRRPTVGDESGMTLVEVTLAAALLSIVLAVALQGLASMQSATLGGELRLRNLDEARTIINTVARDLRTATIPEGGTSPFIVAEADRVTFYANLRLTSGAPNQVELFVDRSDPARTALVERTTAPDPGSQPPTYATQTPVVRVVGRYVVNDASDPLFVYYDADGQLLGTPGQPLTADQASQVRAVDIRVSIRTPTGRPVSATTLVNRVRLANLYFGVLPTPSP